MQLPTGCKSQQGETPSRVELLAGWNSQPGGTLSRVELPAEGNSQASEIRGAGPFGGAKFGSLGTFLRGRFEQPGQIQVAGEFEEPKILTQSLIYIYMPHICFLLNSGRCRFQMSRTLACHVMRQHSKFHVTRERIPQRHRIINSLSRANTRSSAIEHFCYHIRAFSNHNGLQLLNHPIHSRNDRKLWSLTCEAQ